MSNNNNISAVRLGDKIIVFSNGERQVVSKSMSPEIFETLCGYIQNNEIEKIESIFDNFESKLSKFVQEYFTLEEGRLKDVFHNKKHHFSSVLVRKATEMMSVNSSVLPLFNFSKKIFFASSDIEVQADTFFTKLQTINLTKEGNLLLPIRYTGEIDQNTKGVQGEPINVKEEENGIVRKNTRPPYSLKVLKEIKECTHYALISPFDITGFSKGDIIISRYKLYNKKEIESQKGTINIPNEKLFDISYNLFEKKYKNN
tara:strand:- start:4581 stop:5354 length:774 start_codon:yes stop_codon:yes gene_type:complete